MLYSERWRVQLSSCKGQARDPGFYPGSLFGFYANVIKVYDTNRLFYATFAYLHKNPSKIDFKGGGIYRHLKRIQTGILCQSESNHDFIFALSGVINKTEMSLITECP